MDISYCSQFIPSLCDKYSPNPLQVMMFFTSHDIFAFTLKTFPTIAIHVIWLQSLQAGLWHFVVLNSGCESESLALIISCFFSFSFLFRIGGCILCSINRVFLNRSTFLEPYMRIGRYF